MISSGSTYTITWQVGGVADSMLNFSLEYSLDAGSTWTLIDNKLITASYYWQVPKPINNIRTCLIKVKAFYGNTIVGEDISDKVFTIEVVKLTYPNGVEAFLSGAFQTITWATNGTIRPVVTVRLLYLKSISWILITTLSGNPENHDWAVPSDIVKKQSKIRVELRDVNNLIIGGDVSDAPFTVYSGVIPQNPRSGIDYETLVQTSVSAYYNDILGREPDTASRDYWVTEIERIASLGIDIKEGFIALGKFLFNSEEYILKNKTNANYVEVLYQTFWQRDSDAEGKNYWLGLLDQGWTRQMILNGFIFGDEFKICMDEVFGPSTSRPEANLLNDLYRGILGRLPDTEGFNYWLGQMQASECVGLEAVEISPFR